MCQSMMDPEHDEQMKPVRKPRFMIPSHELSRISKSMRTERLVIARGLEPKEEDGDSYKIRAWESGDVASLVECLSSKNKALVVSPQHKSGMAISTLGR